MSYIGYHKTAKYTMVAIISLMMLFTALAGINVAPVKAYEFTLVATVTQNPYYGYYGGYHAIWQSIKNDLAAIGINVEIMQYSDFEWYDRVWDVGWDKSWAEGGWDMTILEWWLQPHAVDPWFTSMVRGDLTPYENGYNIHPWRNSEADEALAVGMQSFNALTRQTYLRAWQDVFMQDPPWINLYYPKVYEVMGRYLTGYEPSGTWFYDVANLTLDNTMLAAARPDRDPSTVIYAVSEEYWAMSPMFMDTYTDEQASTLQWRTLYKWSCDPFPTGGAIPAREDYAILPDMAADYPTYLNNGHTVRVPLRSGMVWRYNNGTTVPIDADDVVWSYTTQMNPLSKCTGLADFTPFIDNVTKFDNLTVDFNLYQPYPDILSVLADDWGGSILPRHKLENIPIGQLKNDVTNYDFSNPASWMPVSGPFMLDPSDPPVTGDHITLIKNPSYYGYALGMGPHNIDKFIMTWIKDPAARLIALQNNDIDFGEYPTAPVSTFKALNNTVNWPYLRVVQYDYPASNPIWINFDNEYLSNRYIRMAIAHAIDYNKIITTILPGWGIETALRGRTYIMPVHHYTDENGTTKQLYGGAELAYSKNVTRALEYMDRWKKSQVGYGTPYPGGTYLEGAAGDANFDDVVDLDDLGIWRDEGWPYGTMPMPFLPGQDKDPDFDNDGSIDQYPDYFIWRDEVPGKDYFP